ncbi:MAG: hypothetical protein HC844_14885 [Tabrizicola sp.]|nr:hypothetical protein [Tabrizicola sp.]
MEEAIRSGIEAIMPASTDRTEVETAIRLIAGAIAEAALVRGSSADPDAAAAWLCVSLERMLRRLERRDRT